MQVYRSPLRTLALALAAVMAGCATIPERAEPEGLEFPEGWTARDGGGPVQGGWLATLGAPVLEDLVREALIHNDDLHAAAARVRQSAASARITGADRLPVAGASFAADRRKINTFGPQDTGGVRFDNFDLQLSVDWEVDLWAKLADRESAAIARYQASGEDYAAARLSLAALVAKGYFNLLEAIRQLDIAKASAQSFTENEEILEGRYQRGLSTGLDLQLIRSAAASARAGSSARKRALDAAARRLEVLLGRYPSNEIALTLERPAPLEPVPAGIPSELLERRPDLRAAERRLAAAYRETRAARKELLPSVSLAASGGTSSDEFSDLLDDNLSVWNLAANALQPIFQGGRISAGIDRSEAVADEALAAYRSAALSAFREVEIAMAADPILGEEIERLERAVAAAELAKVQAWEQYRIGTSDILTALVTERTLEGERSRLATAHNLRRQSRIDLALALGGPIEDSEEPVQTSSTTP